MNRGINLLSKREEIDLKKKNKIKILRIISAVCLGVTALVIIALIILYNQLKIATIKRDQESAIKNISFLHEKSAKLTAINQRIAIISDILKKRTDFQQTASEITKQLSSTIVINGINVSKGEISIRVSSVSLSDIKVFIDKMVALAEMKKIIKDLTIESFVYEPKSNKYNLTINSTLP